jgi:hypothetical protein
MTPCCSRPEPCRSNVGVLPKEGFGSPSQMTLSNHQTNPIQPATLFMGVPVADIPKHEQAPHVVSPTGDMGELRFYLHLLVQNYRLARLGRFGGSEQIRGVIAFYMLNLN